METLGWKGETLNLKTGLEYKLYDLLKLGRNRLFLKLCRLHLYFEDCEGYGKPDLHYTSEKANIPKSGYKLDLTSIR